MEKSAQKHKLRVAAHLARLAVYVIQGHAGRGWPDKTGSMRMQTAIPRTPRKKSLADATDAARRAFRAMIAGAALCVALGAAGAFAQEAGNGQIKSDEAKSNDPKKDWPCQQILVDRISLPAVWAGPAIDDVNWRNDAALADLVQRLAARKTPIEAADASIASFAAAAGPDKPKRLTALFAGLFETLNKERGEIIDGLIRFGRKQKALAAKIRAENADLQNSPNAASPQGAPADSPQSQKLELDLRAFDEGRRSLAFVCESPTLIEQRLFALARSIQNNLD